MMHVSLYYDLLVSAVAYDPDTNDPRVHIDVRNGESKFSTPDRIAYLDITPKQARKLASELVAAADRCAAGVKVAASERAQLVQARHASGWDFIIGGQVDDASENV